MTPKEMYELDPLELRGMLAYMARTADAIHKKHKR
jgi:hypothetical protein